MATASVVSVGLRLSRRRTEGGTKRETFYFTLSLEKISNVSSHSHFIPDPMWVGRRDAGVRGAEGASAPPTGEGL